MKIKEFAQKALNLFKNKTFRKVCISVTAAILLVAIVFGGYMGIRSYILNYQPGGTPASTEVPADFTPVLRFVVASDVHVKGPDCVELVRLQKLFDSSYNYAASQDYKAIDAFVFVADVIDRGEISQWELFMDVVNRNIGDARFITTFSNHEFMGTGSTERSVQYSGCNPNNSLVINGYHFISFSQEDDRSFSLATKKWVKQELKKAEADTGDKPIFVFQHIPQTNTVYGSELTGWGTMRLNSVLNGFPQIMYFSGHSHYNINNPLSINQKNFTSFNLGTLSYIELEKGLTGGTIPENAKNVGQYLIVEVDANGAVKAMPYDIISDSFFKDRNSYADKQLVWYIPNAADRSTYAYTYGKRKQAADKPVFPEDARITLDSFSDGKATITFTQALDGEYLHKYKISVYNESGILVKTYKIWSEYYFSSVDKTRTYTMAGLKPGKKYTVKICGYDCYGKKTDKLLEGTINT